MPDAVSFPASQFSDPLLQRLFLSPQEKADKEKGKAIVKAFYTQQINNDISLNFFKLRSARWTELLLWCKGSQKMQEFLDYMNVSDGNKAWVNIDMTPTRIAAQFVGTLIESMAKNKTYACVNAIDQDSMNEKEERLLDALFRMHDVETINASQQASGLQVEPPNAYVPDDEIAAKVHFELEDQLPKEIRFEKFLAKIKDDIDFEQVANRRTIANGVVLNFMATKIERLAPGEYTVRVGVPTNMVYNFFQKDTGKYEVDQIGEFTSVKVKDLRSQFGKTVERPNGLTEKQLFDLAKLSSNKNIGVINYMWNETWSTPNNMFNQNRPYDDNSVLLFDCEIDCGEDVYFVEKTDAFGKKNISQKQAIPYQQTKKDGTVIEQEKPEGTEIIKRNKNTKMRGVYAPYGDIMLYWGAPDLIITPYTNVSQSLSAWSINIPNNDGDYVPSLFERIMEPLKEYQITKLKRKQLIGKLKPSGIRIDVESLRNVDLGNGDSVSLEEIIRIYDQTGNEIWSSKGLDPLQRESPPLSNTVHDESIEKIIGCTTVLAGIVAEIRQLIGVPQYRDGSDVGDRTSGKLADGQNESSYNVTDFVVVGNNQVWEETYYKLCLLKWNDIVKAEPETKNDMLNTRFKVQVKTKSTEYEKQLLEADIQRYSQMPDAQGNPSLTIKDALMLRNIDNYKLACWYLGAAFEKNRRNAIQESQRLQQQNAKEQAAVSQQNNEAAAQLQQDKVAGEKEMLDFKYIKEKELAFVNGIMQSVTKGVISADIVLPILQQLVPNVVIPLSQENKDMMQSVQANAVQEQMQAQAQQQQQGMPQEQPDQQRQPQQ